MTIRTERVMSLLIIVAASVVFVHLETRPTTSSPPPPPRVPSVPLSLKDAAVEGTSEASLGIIVYSEFQCPFCGAFARTVLPELRRQFIEPGKVLIAFRHFPLPSHAAAFPAAAAAECARRQGNFWVLHDRLFANQQDLGLGAINAYGVRDGLDMARFNACLPMANTAVAADVDRGRQLGVTATPTFFFGRVNNGTDLVPVEVVTGFRPFEEFRNILLRLGAEPSQFHPRTQIFGPHGGRS